MQVPPSAIVEYHAAGKSLICELNASPFTCEFWPLAELKHFNLEYEVPQYAPGYFGFASSGGGEMFALSPSGQVVCLAFIGMSPREELFISNNWGEFEQMLRPA